MNDLTIALNADSGIPLYEQIYDYIKEQIRSGKMEKGMRLPSGRALSEYLEVSRSTVVMAYEQLLSEGYIEARPGAGYFVAEIEGLYHVSVKKRPKAEEIAQPVQYEYDFSPRGIDLNSFPFNNWRKISKNVLVDDNKELFAPGHPQGEADFRDTISKYLYQSRGVSCSPENIIIGAGNEYLMMMIAQLLDENMVYAMENPTYMQAYRILRSLKKEVCAVSLDEYGMNIEELERSRADVAYVTPSHQYPLGVVMPLKRRQELLKWAEQKEERYIIEDDYDSEFRYKGKPIPALRGADREDKVIYIGTFSKSIAPAIRMSYMVLPDRLLMRYRQKLYFYSCTVSRIDQNIVNIFLGEGYYERHLNKMRALYKARHDVLLRELKKLGKDFEICGENAGLHILLTAREENSEQQLIEKAAEQGVRVYPLSSYYIGEEPVQSKTVILGYANMDEEKIVKGVALLLKAWNET